MTGFEETGASHDVTGWTDSNAPAECVSLFDPKFILARAVRSEVFNRLKADHMINSADEEARVIFNADHRSMFLQAILSDDRGAFDEAVDSLELRQKPFSHTLRQLIAPVLDDLGQMWRDDEADFMQVTFATCRVQTFVCEKLVATAKRDRADELHGNILFARAPGETHTFGLTVVTECFRIDGWSVIGGVDMVIGDDLWSLLESKPIDVLGLTVGSTVQIPVLSAAMEQAKRVSLNPNLIIGVGGYCAISDPEAVISLGADFIATDALDAVDTAASFLGGQKTA